MDPIVTLVVGRMASSVTASLARRAADGLIGPPQQRALEKAAREAAEVSARAHSAISQISADIDLLSGDSVIDEVVANAVGSSRVGWDMTRARWRELYQTEPGDALLAFLDDFSSELARRLRGNPTLQPLFLIGRTDVLVDGQDAARHDIRQLSERTDALVDPVRAVRYQGDRVATDLRYATEIIGQVGTQIGEGPFGRAFDIHAALTSTGSTFTIEPNPDHDIRVNVRFLAGSGPDGEARVHAVRSALAEGRDVDLEEAEIEFVVDGVPVPFQGPVRATSRAMTVRQTAVIEFRARGLPPERFLLDFDVSGSPYGGVNAVSRPDSPSPLQMQLQVNDTRRVQASFHASDAGLTIGKQVKIARLARHVARGCRVDIWFAAPDIGMSTSLSANGDVKEADFWAHALALFAEVQQRVGAEVGVIEELTALDVAYLRMAKRFLDRGTATFPGRGGTVTIRTDTDLTSAISPAAVRRGRVPLANAQPETLLPLSRHPLPIGPSTVHYIARWPPQVTTENGVYVSIIQLDDRRPIRITRGVPSEGVAPSPAPSAS